MSNIIATPYTTVNDALDSDEPGVVFAMGAASPRSGRLFRGNGAPFDMLGAYGSLYIDTATGNLYTKDAPIGPKAWTYHVTFDTGSQGASYAFMDGKAVDAVGAPGDYCLVFDPLTSCTIEDAYLVGPKLAGSDSRGTWIGATSVLVSTVSTYIP